MNRLLDQVLIMLGREPQKPAQISAAAQQIHQLKRLTNKENLQAAKAQIRGHDEKSHKWRNRRWAVLMAVNLLFVVSFHFDIQLLEGALTASRFMGFHLIDLNSALQVMLAHKHIIVNLVIGTATVFVLWLLLGGRTFCSWVCPYHLIAEWAEELHLFLVRKKLVADQNINRTLRTVFWLLFAVLAAASGYTVFEAISPTGILSRALIYGPGLALLWVFALLVFEVFISRRAWCRYACPIGLPPGQLLPRGRLPQGLPGAPCPGHGDQGPRRRHRSADRPGLHALRPVRRRLPDRLAELRRQGPVETALRSESNHEPIAQRRSGRPDERTVGRAVRHVPHAARRRAS